MKGRPIGKKMGAVLLSLLSLCLFLSACSIGGRKVYFSSGAGIFSVFRIGDLTCPEKEARLYLVNYRNLYGSVGGVDLFKGDFDRDRLEESLKSAVLTHLTRVYSLDQYALDHKVSLSDQEKDRVKEAAKAYFDSLTEKEREALSLSENDIDTYYERLALAEKVYRDLMGTVDDEVSEDEARVMIADVVMVKDRKEAETLKGLIASGTSFELLTSYNEGPTFQTAIKRKDYPEAVERAAFSLEEGETAGPVESDGSYYFIKCLTKYDKTLSDQNKEKILEDRKKALMEKIIESQEKKYYSELNQKTWSSLTVPKEGQVKTSSFFSTLHQYISF